jgi:hypothetical protein
MLIARSPAKPATLNLRQPAFDAAEKQRFG